MERITITIDEDLLKTVDELAARKGYSTRSEAIREMLRNSTTQPEVSDPAGPCVGVLGYIYDHHTRALSQRINNTFHDHHNLVISSLHVHLDHGSCLEVSVLAGPLAQVQALAKDVTAQRGVRHGTLHTMPGEGYFHHQHGHRHEHD